MWSIARADSLSWLIDARDHVCRRRMALALRSHSHEDTGIVHVILMSSALFGNSKESVTFIAAAHVDVRFYAAHFCQLSFHLQSSVSISSWQILYMTWALEGFLRTLPPLVTGLRVMSRCEHPVTLSICNTNVCTKIERNRTIATEWGHSGLKI